MTDVTGATPEPRSWVVDEFARRCGVPVRTIREYQTLGLLHAPRRSGRIGLYDDSHQGRLELIGRLQRRGYSLAGIGDLLEAWRDGADLGDILDLDPDQLVHVDEPGAPATLDQLGNLLPGLVPSRLDELLATGVVERSSPDRFCIVSPSLLQLTVDALTAGIDPDAVLIMLSAFRDAADLVGEAVLTALGGVPGDADPGALRTTVGRGRGLLSHGLGRLTLHRIGARAGISDEDDASAVATALTRGRRDRTSAS